MQSKSLLSLLNSLFSFTLLWAIAMSWSETRALILRFHSTDVPPQTNFPLDLAMTWTKTDRQDAEQVKKRGTAQQTRMRGGVRDYLSMNSTRIHLQQDAEQVNKHGTAQQTRMRGGVRDYLSMNSTRIHVQQHAEQVKKHGTAQQTRMRGGVRDYLSPRNLRNKTINIRL